MNLPCSRILREVTLGVKKRLTNTELVTALTESPASSPALASLRCDVSMESTENKQPLSGQDEASVQEAVTQFRQNLKDLRAALVQRIVDRVTTQQEYPPDLRAHPDQYAPLDSSKVQLELVVARMLATFLLDPTTTLPMEVDALHRRVSGPPCRMQPTQHTHPARPVHAVFCFRRHRCSATFEWLA